MCNPMLRIVTEQDIQWLTAQIRMVDALEIKKTAPGISIREAIELSVGGSDICYSIDYGRKLICICGVGQVNLRESTATIWALGTRAMERIPLQVLRYSRCAVRLLLEALPEGISACNMVWDGNTATLRWLKWLGAEFTHSIYEHGENFTVFRLKKEGV